MFNIGPMELLVLAVVALVVLGPDKLPQLARDAARVLRTLRDLAQGAQKQLREELGPEFADVDLRSLNPRTALTKVMLGDAEVSDMRPSKIFSDTFTETRDDLKSAVSDVTRSITDPVKESADDAVSAVSLTKADPEAVASTAMPGLTEAAQANAAPTNAAQRDPRSAKPDTDEPDTAKPSIATPSIAKPSIAKPSIAKPDADKRALFDDDAT